MVGSRRLSTWLALVVAASTVGIPARAEADPVISLWYRGTPVGTPRRDDLAAIRALGFSGVTWTDRSERSTTLLREMAAQVGLSVIIRDSVRPIAADSTIARGAIVDIALHVTPPELTPALVWRALALGARVVSFDTGAAEGVGLTGADGQPPAWVPWASNTARHVGFNQGLLGALRAGPPVRSVGEKPPGVDVILLDGDRSWVMIATNAGRGRASFVVELAPHVPYALWTSLIDGSTLAMLAQASGPRWTAELPGGAAAVFAIDKQLR